MKKLPLPQEPAYKLEESCLNIEKLRQLTPQWAGLASYLNSKGFALYRNTRATYLQTGKKFLEDMLDAMERAERFIFLEYFIMAEGELWDRLTDVLRRKSGQGVEIKLIFDDFGSMMRMPAEKVEALRRAGAEVLVINASPDGYNINKNAGSTHPEQLQAMVKATDAVMGVAFDGDADRCLAVDEDGNMVNGDQIMGILARAKKEAGKLADNTLVVTVMSNLGLKLALKDMGIKTVQTAVGDRYVLEEMLRGGYTLGGEQSGHVINREFATTGDGTLTALTLCNEVVKSGKSLKQLAADFPQLPQQLVNVPNVDKMAATTNAAVQAAVDKEAKRLGDTGRGLLRPSGTEPLVRVMAEAATQQQADEVCDRLAKVVADELAL